MPACPSARRVAAEPAEQASVAGARNRKTSPTTRSTSSCSRRRRTPTSAGSAATRRARRAKPACEVPGCGAVPLLKQHADFQIYPDALAEGRVLRLYDRDRGGLAKAAELGADAGATV